MTGLLHDLSYDAWQATGAAVPLDRPVVVRQGACDWPAMTALNFEGLAARAGEAIVRVVQSASGAHTPMRLDDFLRYCRTSTDADPWYLRDWHYRDTHPELRALIEVPPACVSWLEDLPPAARPDWSWVYIGSAGSGTPFHHDTHRTSAWNAVFEGHKSWEAEVPGMPGHVVSWEQHAGDLVVVPTGWVDRVVNRAPTVAFSENFVNASNVDAVLAAHAPDDPFRRVVALARALRR